LATQVEARGDDIVPKTGCGEENDLRAHDVAIRRRIFARHGLQRDPFVATERNEKRAPPGHKIWSAATMTVPYRLDEYKLNTSS